MRLEDYKLGGENFSSQTTDFFIKCEEGGRRGEIWTPDFHRVEVALYHWVTRLKESLMYFDIKVVNLSLAVVNYSDQPDHRKAEDFTANSVVRGTLRAVQQ